MSDQTHMARLGAKAVRSIEKPHVLAVLEAIMSAPKFQFNQRAGRGRTLAQPDCYLNRPRRVTNFSGGMQGGLEIMMGLRPKMEKPFVVKITTQ